MDWLMGLPLTAQGFDQVEVHVDYLSDTVDALLVDGLRGGLSDAAKHILDMALRSGDGIPDVLFVDHDPKFTSNLISKIYTTRRLQSYRWFSVPQEYER